MNIAVFSHQHTTITVLHNEENSNKYSQNGNKLLQFKLSLSLYIIPDMGDNATGTLGGHRSSAEDARIEAP